jgi:membrane-bound serine protease (ClpP class)
LVVLLALGAILFPWVHRTRAQSAPSAPAPASLPATAPAGDSRAAVVVIKGQIDDFERDQLVRNFDRARAVGAKTVVVQINTYGGLVTSGLDISNFLKRQTDLRTIAFIDEKAISAGAMIALACDEIVMAPSAVIGDCAPISYRTDGTLVPMGAAERAKAESPVLADFRDSARRNGYDTLLAESMVAVGREVYYLQSGSGEKRFVNKADHDKLAAEGWKAVDGVPSPVDAQDELLTVHTDLAIKLGIAKAAFPSIDALAANRGLSVVDVFAPGAGEAFVELLGNPLTRLLLIIVFVSSMKAALAAPGTGAPEAVALLSFGALVGIPLLTGFAEWWEIILILGGLAFIAFEIFVLPGHFVGGAVGTLMLITGLIMTFVGNEPGGFGWPQLGMTWDAIARGMLVVTGGLLGSLIAWIWLGRFLPKIPYFNKLVLTATSGDLLATESVSVMEPNWPATGVVGTAVTQLKPGGSARFMDHATGDTRVTAVISDSGFLESGTKIVVRHSSPGRVVVRPVENG